MTDLFKNRRISLSFARMEWRRKYDMTSWQRILVLAFESLMILVSVPLNILGLSGPANFDFFVLNTLQYVCLLAILTLFWLKVLNLNHTLAFVLLMKQCYLATEMVFCSTQASQHDIVIIMGDLFLSFGIVVLAQVANYKRLPFALMALSALPFIACVFISSNPGLLNFLPLILLASMLVPVLGYILVNNFKHLEADNMKVRQTERTILDALGIDEEAAMQFVKNKNKPDRFQLLSLCNEPTRQRIVNEALAIHADQKYGRDRLAQRFPQLTPSEIEICRLILQGKRLNEICLILGKEKSNITSQRSHIRSKLNITDPRADLLTQLQAQLNT